MIIRKATVLLSVLSLILTSCGGGSGGGSASVAAPAGSTDDELSISGRVSSIISFMVPSAHADELPVCKSTCNEAINHCATFSVFSNIEPQEISLCKTVVSLDGSFSFELKNKNALKQFMTKIAVTNFNNERRELVEYINPDIGSIVTFNINQETTLVAPIIQEKAQSENPQNLSEENKNQGQLLKRDLMAMCPGIITEDNVQDVIRNYLGELASGRGRFLVVEYRKRIEGNLSIEDLSEQIGAFCSLVEGMGTEVPPSPTPTPTPTQTPIGPSVSNCALNNTATIWIKTLINYCSTTTFLDKSGFDFDSSLPVDAPFGDIYFSILEDANGISQATINAPWGIKVFHDRGMCDETPVDTSGMTTSILYWTGGSLYDFNGSQFQFPNVSPYNERTTFLVKTRSGKFIMLVRNGSRSDGQCFSIGSGWGPNYTVLNYLGAVAFGFSWRELSN